MTFQPNESVKIIVWTFERKHRCIVPPCNLGHLLHIQECCFIHFSNFESRSIISKRSLELKSPVWNQCSLSARESFFLFGECRLLVSHLIGRAINLFLKWYKRRSSGQFECWDVTNLERVTVSPSSKTVVYFWISDTSNTFLSFNLVQFANRNKLTWWQVTGTKGSDIDCVAFSTSNKN